MEIIYNDNSNLGGTYKITNKVNGKTYYGSTKKFSVRASQHSKQLSQNKHGNSYLQSAFKIDGTSNFLFEVIEVILGTKQDRLDAEQLLLDQHWDGCIDCYNVEKNAFSREGRSSKNPKETHKKISLARIGHIVTEETRRKIGSSNKGKKRSEETKQKLREARKFQFTDDVRKRMSEAHKGNKASIETKKKMSFVHIGKKMPPITEETRKKMSDVQKGRAPWNKGKIGCQKHSEETKRKMSESHRKRKSN